MRRKIKYKRSNLRYIFHRENMKRAELQKESLMINDIQDATNISRQTLNRWFSDEPIEERRISAFIIDGLCRFFGVSKEELLSDIEQSDTIEEDKRELA